MSIDYATGDDHVVTITINRPEARNSMDMEHFFQLRSAWDRFGEDDDAYVAIVTGVGQGLLRRGRPQDLHPPDHRAAEQDEGGPAPDELGGYRLDDGVKAVLRGTKLYKPIIAAVNGTCVAGGMEMLGGTDLRVASDTATFGVMEPKRGLFAGGGTTVRLPRQIPYPAAMELLLCADQVPAQRAYEMGLLNEVCRPADLMERAYDYAHRITANGPFAIRKTKESVLRGLATDMKEAYRIESEISGEVFSSEDAKEGPRAFAEKRRTELAEPLRTGLTWLDPTAAAREHGDTSEPAAPRHSGVTRWQALLSCVDYAGLAKAVCAVPWGGGSYASTPPSLTSLVGRPSTEM